MADDQHNELLQRIATLVRQNEKLKRQVSDLTNKNDELLIILDTYKKGLKLKEAEKQDTLKFKMVTVLLVQITGFDEISKYPYAQEMLDELDRLYIRFDEIVSQFKIEKVKTIGDAYMCAGGVPVKNHTNPVDVVLAALEMKKIIHFLQDKFEKEGKKFWNFRMGIHTGPATATTIGKKKVSYNLKGDTVNIASRLQSAGETGKINLSVMSYEMIREYFSCEYHGTLPVKYKENYDMYYVKQIKKAYSQNREGKDPNEIFQVKYKLRQFADLQEIYLDKLEKELPAFLYYHNVKHTIDVITQVELIGWGEGVTDHDLLLLKTAALFHDMGQIGGSRDHEDRSCEYSRQYLPAFGYTAEEIENICEIIMATKMPPQPKTILQRIICDADLDYLGRSDFIPVSDTLFRELNEQGIIECLNEWNKMQIKFLTGHAYFTETARNLREVNKQDQIDRIKSLITE
ncbi:MAG: adenylate/guanylate cyclase domain-containing protein [Bacteroidota bacterium]